MRINFYEKNSFKNSTRIFRRIPFIPLMTFFYIYKGAIRCIKGIFFFEKAILIFQRIHIYIDIHRWTVSLHHNFSAWLDTWVASSLDWNLPNFTLDLVHTAQPLVDIW